MKTKILLIGLFWFLLIFSLQLKVNATNYYVSTTGNDGNNGLSTSSAWRTIAKACFAVPANAGHVINIGGGTFVETSSLNVPSGTTVQGAGAESTIITSSVEIVCAVVDKNNITISNLKIDGTGQYTGKGVLLKVYNSQTIRVFNVNLSNGDSQGLQLSGGSSDIIVDGGHYVEAGGRGNVDGDKVVVAMGPLTNAVVKNLLVEDSQAQAMRAWGTIKNVVVTRNVCRGAPTSSWNNGTSGILGIEYWGVVNMTDCEISYNDIKGSLSLSAVDNHSLRVHHNIITGNYGIEVGLIDIDHLEIDHNFIHHCGYAFANFMGSNENVGNYLIHHNVCYNTGFSIFLHMLSGVDKMRVYNNTVYNDVTSDNNPIFNYIVGQVSDCQFDNNIFAQKYGYPVNTYEQATRSNLFWTTKALGLDSISGNPEFVNINGSDGSGFALKSNSPAINKGCVINVITDDAIGIPDIGAFEYGKTPWQAGPNAPEETNTTSTVTNFFAVPGMVNSNQFTAFSNVETSNNEIVSFDNSGDWIEYAINPKFSGDYSIEFTVSNSSSTDAEAKLMDDGKAIATFAVPSTGNNNTFVKVAVPVKLRTGGKHLWIKSTKGTWNLKSSEYTCSGGLPIVTASAENKPWDVISNINDGNGSTKWVVFNNKAWVQHEYVLPVIINGYKITASDNAPNFDPKNWNILGSNDGINWVVIKSEVNQVFVQRKACKQYAFENTTPYRYYRWDILSTLGNEGTLQVAEFEFTNNQTGISINITSPASGSEFDAATIVTINAAASTKTGTINKVEFFANDIKLGEDVTEPYQFNWADVPAGTHTLKSVAWNSLDSSWTSPDVIIQGVLYAKILQSLTEPIIDGKKDNSYPSITDSMKIVISSTVPSKKDLSACWTSMYDSKNLYFFVSVTDDKLVKDSPDNYKDDNVSIWIDADNSKDITYGDNDYGFSFGWNRPIIDVFYHKERDYSGVKYKIIKSTTGYDLEVCFPWAALGGMPAGKMMAIEVQVDDDDDGGERDHELHWSSSTGDAYQYPYELGMVKLSDETTALNIPELNQCKLKVYPNPSSGIIKLELADSNAATYEVINATGQIIQSGEFLGDSEKIDLLGRKGLFFVRVKNSTTSFLKKIFVY